MAVLKFLFESCRNSKWFSEAVDGVTYQREITDKQREVISRIVDYIASNGACTIRDIREDDATHAAQMIRAFGNMQKADEALHSLYTFVVLRKAA